MNTRKEMLRVADEILKANPEPKQPAVRIRYRGQRPAMNWLRKHDRKGAACLWLIARDRLPPDAANDNQADAKDLGVDRRKDGRARGPRRVPTDAEEYLERPAALPSPLAAVSAERVPVRPLTGFHGWFELKPGVRSVVHADCCYTLADAAVAEGAFFIGAIGGLGQPKTGKSRGDMRRVAQPESPQPPDEVDTVIEVMLSGGNVADVGKALGARGGYADRRGGAALLAAARWAKVALAA
ncbi:hypothetical protein KEU06_13765 [Pseudaminobacter sp. 19-2017]|uniref:Uncharacterized protein n=1 Tax=Pseudaminobacter soli (ex Zhang et al. 2022) TaxID=2831468 RepID=A0A942E286_9HYPH|nr:hypothetical protein [Pseudaminobacter soli]MBS3649675.1 hypothetical protein [Pseudaminobacter soli]